MGLEDRGDSALPPPVGPQPCSLGFSSFGFSWLPLCSWFDRFRRGNALQTVMDLLLGVVLALVADIRLDPLQVLRAETDDAVATLPLQYLAAPVKMPVRLMR